MAYRLIRATSKSGFYDLYREIFLQIEYSILLGKGQELPPYAKMLMRGNAEKFLWSEEEFLEKMKNPNQAVYFFETNGKINGFSYIVYKGKYCDIVEFTVHDKGKGLGRIYFQELKREFSKHGVTTIRLQCPSHLQGSQAFWQKIGFQLVPPYQDIFAYSISIRN